MAKTDFRSVDAYLDTQPAETRAVLETVRAAIRKAVPRAQEAISYQIPAFKLDGRPLIFFAGWKSHFSLYPATDGLRQAFRKELAKVDINDRGTIRFALAEPVPVRLIARLAKFRAQEVAEELGVAASRKNQRKASSVTKPKNPLRSSGATKPSAARSSGPRRESALRSRSAPKR